MWRKNRATSNSVLNLLVNCRGVDLNRNFGYHWGQDLDLLLTTTGTPVPCHETFIGNTRWSALSSFCWSGDSAFSEPETAAVRNFVLQNRHKLVGYLSYHSFGEKILYPWSHTADKVQDKLHSIQCEAWCAGAGLG